MYAERPVPNRRRNTPAISSWSCGGVNAGVHFFPPLGFPGQEPRRRQRQRLVVIPSPPGPYFVVRQPRLPFGSLQALLDPVLGLEHPGELPTGGGQRRVGQQVAVLPAAAPLPLLAH